MTRVECEGILSAQLSVMRLHSMLELLSEATDEGSIVDALDLCAEYAKSVAVKIDDIPGFIEAQRHTR